MAEQDNATRRAAVLIGLLIGSGAALRGRLPPVGSQPLQFTPGPAAPMLLTVLLAGSLVIVAAAVVNRMRNRLMRNRGIRELPVRPGGDLRGSAWRVLLIGLAVLAGWTLVIWLLSRLAGQPVIGGPAAPTDNPAGPPAPGDVPTRTGVAPPSGGPAPTPSGAVFGYLAWTALALLMLTTAVAAGHRGHTGRRPPAAADDPTPTLARAAALGLAEIGRADRDPRRAIIACYAAMERQLGQIPDAQPQACDTPTEVLTRAISHHVLAPGNATALVDLFAEARFSAHPMTERHRTEAVRILSLVRHELREPA